ncbi:MAG: hypothetical protein WC596_00040 [Candidatus Shapirobacteria bacterium]
MEKSDISVTTRKKLKKLVDKKYRLIDLADQVKKKKEDYLAGKSLLQEFEEDVTNLFFKIKNIKI